MSATGNVGVDPFSLRSIPIEILCDGEVLGLATGFFVEKQDKLFLVSNWHVFSGRNPADGQPKDSMHGRVPTHLKVMYHSAFDSARIQEAVIPLQSNNQTSLWFQHKIHGQKVDVAAIQFQVWNVYARPFAITDVRQELEMEVTVASDIFVLGFPFGIRRTGILPIWKRGSVATEMKTYAGGLPRFLIDTATRDGMSGSPVIARSFGNYTNNVGTFVVTMYTNYRFLGIYSGRYTGDLEEAQLGIVWRPEVVDQMIDDPAAGDFELF